LADYAFGEGKDSRRRDHAEIRESLVERGRWRIHPSTPFDESLDRRTV